jgi:hypothetical protein
MANHGYICVQHLRGTSECEHENTTEGSWIKEWMKVMKKERPSGCLMAFKEGSRYVQCPNTATVGAHIIIPASGKIFIIPSCSGCNNEKRAEERGHCAFAHKDMLMELPNCICDKNDKRNAIKSRVQQLSPKRLNNAHTVAYSMGNPVSSPTLQEIFDEMESLMKNPRFPNYWKTEAEDHRKETAKYNKQHMSKALNVRDLSTYIRDMLDPISVPKSKINELVDKAIRINKTH